MRKISTLAVTFFYIATGSIIGVKFKFIFFAFKIPLCLLIFV